MTTIEIRKEILKTINVLNKEQQLKLLGFVDSLISKKAKSEFNILNLAGSISKEDLRLMQEAINEDCETIDKNEW